MRVFFDDQIFSEQAYGGISRYFAELARELDQLPETTVRISSPLCTNHYARELSGSLLTGYPLPASIKAGRLIRNINRLVSIPVARRFRPDVLHETYYWNRRHPVRPKLGVVTTVHDMIHERFPNEFVHHALTSERKQQSVREADLVICDSENTRRDLVDISGIDPRKTRVVHLGVDHLRVPERNPEPILDRPYVLYVGQREGYKNFERLLEAFATSANLSTHFRLVCFGGGPLSPNERNRARRLGLTEDALLFKSGSDDVLVGLYRQAELLVYPSLYEGFGIPPLEAMSFGCPVASSQVSSMPEVLGDAAHYFDPEDVGSIQHAIEHVLGNPSVAEDLKQRGRRHARRFTWAETARKTLAAYQELE